jgi:type II secretion system protein I
MSERENGSVLIEAMVAAAIVSMMLVTMYQSIDQSMTGATRVADKRMALLIAQSEMDAVGTVLPVSGGSKSGAEGSFVWRVDIVPYPVATGPSNSGSLYEVTVSVRDRSRDADLVSLHTLRIGSAS